MSGPYRQPCDPGIARTAREGPPCGPVKRWLTLAACVLGSSLVFIDGSVVSVALPAMRSQLGADVGQTQWIVNIYMLFLAAFILIGGAAADRFGRRAVFLIGVALFTLASVVCALAPGVEVLLIGRAIQGLAGAALAPASLALIAAVFPKETRGAAIGIWAGASALTTAGGPVLGGWIVDALSWRYVFYLNLPLAAAAAGMALAFAPESRDESAERLDWPGAALIAVALGALALGLTRLGEHSPADPAGWALLAFAATFGALFLMRERRAKAPMMPLGIFRSASFSALNGQTLLLYAALSAAFLVAPFALTEGRGMRAAAVGAAFLPFTVPMGFLSSVSGALQRRVGPRRLLTFGPLVAGAGFALMAAGEDWPLWAGILLPMALTGLGVSLFVAPLTDGVIAAAPEKQEGLASGVNNAASRIAGLVGVALAGATAAALGGFAEAFTLVMAAAAAAMALGAGLGWLGGTPAATRSKSASVE